VIGHGFLPRVRQVPQVLRVYDKSFHKSHKSCTPCVSQCFPQTHKQKNVHKGKKGEKGWGNKRKPSGHWGCGSRHHRTNIECTQSVLLSEMHLQIEKKQENERSKSEEETRIHHRTDTDYIINQTPTHCSSGAYANLFERQFFSLCFLPFAHRTRRRQCAAALRGCASFRCFPHPFSLVFIIFLLTDQRHGRQCAGARSGCM
jgi:hypothetical protein